MLTRSWSRLLALGIMLGAFTLFAPVGHSFSASASVLHAKRRGCVIAPVGAPSTDAFAAETGAPTAWPYTIVAPKAAAQVFDPATDSLYGLVTEVRAQPGPDLLEGLSLEGGHTRDGPTIGLGGGFSELLSLADGSLWVGASLGRGNDPPGPELCQVDPVTLHLVRQVALPAPRPRDWAGLLTLVSPGPHHTVWVGYGNTLALVDVRTGAIVSVKTIASGSIASLATDPEDHLLYVSISYPTIDGKKVDAAIQERVAMSGKLLTTTSATSPVTESVSGGDLTALPNGVATSFRTGMRGATELLDSAGLKAITPPGLGPADGELAEPPGDVFSWPMGDSTLYAAGDLWIQNEWGVLACVNPVTGAVFASEQTLQPSAIFMTLLDAQPATHQLLALFGDQVISITAPVACWH